VTEKGRRLLELLAASDDGSTEALLLAHGFALDLIESIEFAGLATAQAEPDRIAMEHWSMARRRLPTLVQKLWNGQGAEVVKLARHKDTGRPYVATAVATMLVQG